MVEDDDVSEDYMQQILAALGPEASIQERNRKTHGAEASQSELNPVIAMKARFAADLRKLERDVACPISRRSSSRQCRSEVHE